MSQRKPTNTEWLVQEVKNGWIVRPASFRDPGRFNDPEETMVFSDMSDLSKFLIDNQVLV